MQIVGIVRNEERPVTELFGGERHMLINVLFFFSKFLPILFSPVIDLNAEVGDHKDLST